MVNDIGANNSAVISEH